MLSLYMMPTQPSGPELQLIGGDGSQSTLTLTDLEALTYIERYGSYQNTFGNVRGQGVYKGVAVSMLVQMIGGMQEEDLLVVNATDGYSQTFTYQKVFPDTSTYDLQGDMVLAYEFNQTKVPDYELGYRLVFLTLDGYYTNDDAGNSSSPEYYAGAAGPQCVSNVASITVIDVVPGSLVLTLSFGDDIHQLTMSDLMALPSVSGTGGYIKRTGTIVFPLSLTGVAFGDLLQLFDSLPDDYTLQANASDGYTTLYNETQLNGLMEGFDPSTGESVGLKNFTMLLAYIQDGEPLTEGGPLRIVFTNEDGYISESKYWAKNVASIEVISSSS